MSDRLMRRPDRDDRDRDRRDDRYGRRRHDSREEEPEWFSAGPTSQHDTIELRGFEDIPEDGQVLGRGKKTPRSKATSKATPVGRKNSDSSVSSSKIVTTPPPQDAPKKASPDGKGDKARVGGPLATSSPDTKEKKARQNKTNEALHESKNNKDHMDVAEEALAQAGNGRGDPLDRPDVTSSSSAQIDFNLDDFLKIDSLPMLMNGGQTEATTGGSRFRQWFSRNSPTNDGIRTVPDDLNNMINDITEPTISIPSGNDSFFAPISPAASSVHKQHLQQQLHARLSNQNPSNKLLEMLRRGSDMSSLPAHGEIPSIKDLEASGKLHSVEELEARIRPKPGDGGAMPPVREPRLADPAIASVVHHGSVQSKEEEVAAFRKLIMKPRAKEPQIGSEAPIGGSNNSIMNAFTGMPQASSTSIGSAAHSISGQHHSQTQPQQMNIPEDLLMKLLQVQQQQQQQQQQQHSHHPQQQQQQHLHHQQQQRQQHQQQHHQHQQIQQHQQQQDMLAKLMNNARMSQQQMHQPHQMQQASRRQGPMIPPSHYSNMQPSNRSPLPPDVQSLIANTPLNHDLLQRAEAQAILRGLVQGEITTQNLVQQLQNPAITRRHQELLLSVLKTQSMKGQRVPSPREMALHTQNMQSALIKKKLEEQKESLRKRQEPHRSLSPNIGNFNNNSMMKNDAKHPMSSPSPLAFTPTSVLKKMNAEKEGELKIGGLPGGITMSDLQQMQQGPRHPSIQLSASQVQQQQQPPLQHRLPPNWNQNKSQAQPQGRPILKSNNNFSYSGNDNFPSQQSGASQNHLQQMQGMPPYMRGPPPSQFNARSKMTLSTPPPNMTQQPPQYNMNIMQARPPMPQSSNPHGMSHGGAGDVSSNANQLSRWFSPELLAQARSGPSVPAQGMLSVEDIERLQQAVHN